MAVVLTGLLFSLSASAILTDPSCGIVPVQKLNYATSTQVDKFDSTLGELKSVIINGEACGNISRDISSEDLSPDGVDYRVICIGQIIPNLPGQGEEIFQLKIDETNHLATDDEPNSLPDWAGDDFWALYLNDCTDIQTYTITDPVKMAPYIGFSGEKIQIPVRTYSSNTVEGSNEYFSRGQTFMGITICVQYEYEPRLCINGSKINDCTGKGIEGWLITLKDSTGAVIAQKSTDTSGSYSFCGLAPGDYLVCEEDRPGWAHLDEPCRSVTLVDENVDGVDFLNVPLFSISGHKYHAKTGEGLSGWTINLLKDGKVIKTTTTGTGGYYEFKDLAPGDYEVCEVMKPDWKAVGPTCIPVTLDCANSENNDFENEPTGNLVCVCPFFLKNELYIGSCKEVKVVDASKGILANDQPGSVVLNPESITIDPKYGTIEVHEDGSFVYDPTGATGKLYSGLYVVFKYTANNGLCDSQYPGTAKIQLYCPK